MNLALLTDGLRAEREQGITIDVAYRYFATPKRKFIIADTPGHIQYTRNMITGASTADLALDPRRRPQRHHRAVAAARVPRVAARRAAPRAVREQDGPRRLRPGRVRAHQGRVPRVRGQARRARPRVHPDLGAARRQRRRPLRRTRRGTRARACCTTSKRCTSPPTGTSSTAGSRCSTSSGRATTAIHDYRGYAGQVASGTYKKGDEVVVLPSGFTSTIASIDTADGEVEEATPPMSVTIRLADDLDVSRGDMICRVHNRPQVGQDIDAMLCWFSDGAPLKTGAKYAVKHTSNWARALVKDLQYRLDVNTLHRDEAADVAVAERDRPGHAANDAAASLRRIPAQPRNGFVHPRRRGDQQHRRRGHDRLSERCEAGIPPSSERGPAARRRSRQERK